MAITSYLSRIIYKEFDGEDLQTVDFAGSYKLLVRAKTIPAPMGSFPSWERGLKLSPSSHPLLLQLRRSPRGNVA